MEGAKELNHNTSQPIACLAGKFQVCLIQCIARMVHTHFAPEERH